MTKNREGDYRVVYTTEEGALCPECKRPKNKCSCAEARRLSVKGDGNVRVRRETNGRGGKTVTTITGLALNQNELQALLKDLKRTCGAGGAVKDGILEVQGDHCDIVLRELARRGMSAKRAGG
jgi:translation initiation factor 1